MKPEIKKLLILNLPYLLFVWLFDKVGAAVRLSPGADASATFYATKQMMNMAGGFPSMLGAYLMNLRISGRYQSLKSSLQRYGAGKSPRQSSCRASHS